MLIVIWGKTYVLLVRGMPKGKGCKGHGKSKSKSRRSRNYFHCHKEGHFRRDCLERK